MRNDFSSDDQQRDNPLLTQILEVGSSLFRNLNLDSLLQEIAQAVHHSLDFGAVVLNLVDEDSKQVRVRAYAGLDDEGRQILEGAVYDWEEFAKLFQERFRVGRCYFISHDEFDWERDFQGPVYRVVGGEVSGDGLEDIWHPDDSLFVPIQLNEDQIVGVISVDQPLDGRRPSSETLQALEIFANQAAIAIANARLYEQAQQKIAERKQVEEELLKFKLGIERSDAAIFLTDTDGTILYVNPAFEEIYGYSREEALGKTPRILKSGVLPPEAYKEFWDTLFARQVVAGELINKTKDGQLLIVEGSANPVLDEEGNIIGFLAIQRDVTQRKQVEETLKRLSSVVEQTTDPVVITDKDGIIEYVNSAFKELTGYTQEEAIGQTPRIVKSGEHDEKFYEGLWSTILSGNSYRGVVVNRKKNGELFYEEKTITPLKDDQGNITHFVSTGKDITERKQMEETLARERDLLQTLMDNMPDYIFFKDAESRFIKTNKIHAQFLGLAEPQEAVGKTDFDFWAREDAQEFYDEEQQVIRSGQPIIDRVGQTLDLSTGEMRWLSETKIPLADERGRPLGLVAIARDITERKVAEVERERLLSDLTQRTTQLQTATEVSRAASSILNPDELIQQVVNLVRDRFELYYAGLFLIDQTGEWTGEPGRWAVLRAGTGEAGRQMMAEGHKLEIGGESMVGWCVANKQARVAWDVGEEAMRFENPLLPETRSEMALPLIVRGQVIGAMTVQSTREAAFSDEDIAVLQTMADQVAVAIENAHLLEQAQARAERERLVRTITERVRRGTDPEAIMRITLQELGQMLGASQSIVRLGTQEQLLSMQETQVRKTKGA